MDHTLAKELSYPNKFVQLAIIGSEVASNAPALRSISSVSWFLDWVLSSNVISKGVKPSEFREFISTLQFNKHLTICWDMWIQNCQVVLKLKEWVFDILNTLFDEMLQRSISSNFNKLSSNDWIFIKCQNQGLWFHLVYNL